MEKILAELQTKFSLVRQRDLDTVLTALHRHRTGQIVGFAAGRMGYSLRAFIMRLCHMRFDAFMIGDTNFPRITSDTLVLVNSSSGETPTIKLYVEQAASHGAEIITFTDNPGSTIAGMSTHVVDLGIVNSSQIMKSLNEQFSFLLFDFLADLYIDQNKLDLVVVSSNHSISE